MDYIRWVLGDEVESVYATGTSSDEELKEKGVIDNATMVMKFKKGEEQNIMNVNMLRCVSIAHMTREEYSARSSIPTR